MSKKEEIRFTIALPLKERQLLRERAAKAGISCGQLVRNWITERLNIKK